MIRAKMQQTCNNANIKVTTATLLNFRHTQTHKKRHYKLYGNTACVCYKLQISAAYKYSAKDNNVKLSFIATLIIFVSAQTATDKKAMLQRGSF